MNKFLNIVILTMLYTSVFQAQSIRKDYKEMTRSEKNALVDAFYELGGNNGNEGIVNELAEFHSSEARQLHNVPNFDNDAFLAWHRRQIFELEQAMQDINPNISIPFWDWTKERTLDSDLWDDNFLGQFNEDWQLGRTFSPGIEISAFLPTQEEIDPLYDIDDFQEFSTAVERDKAHGGPHNWVNGVMTSMRSPADPVFYLHHGMIDKIWQDWVEKHDITSSDNIYENYTRIIVIGEEFDPNFSGDLLRYDGMKPNDIVDSRALGVFFAENKLAKLDDYTVSNTYHNLENFYYQYDIHVGNEEAKVIPAFLVPSRARVKFESVNGITLKSGFHSQRGSYCTVKIDKDANVNTNARSFGKNQTTRNTQNFNNIKNYGPTYEDVYGVSTKAISWNISPNPASQAFKVKINSKFSLATLEITDMQGKIILSKALQHNIENIDISKFDSGAYVVIVTLDGGSRLHKKLVKQ